MLEKAPSWQSLLQEEFHQTYMKDLRFFLNERVESGINIYPPKNQWFRAFELTPVDQVKVVILGQDPYHQPAQAHGLSFSVRSDVKIPPSLRNIFKELVNDLNIDMPAQGSLEPWAKEGVLLLNAVLTVEDSQANAHQGIGWETFTDRVISEINDACPRCVFILWGAAAQQKGKKIDRQRHLVIESVHPSPLSAHRGFFGSKPFSKANNWLIDHDVAPINWTLSGQPQGELF